MEKQRVLGLIVNGNGHLLMGRSLAKDSFDRVKAPGCLVPDGDDILTTLVERIEDEVDIIVDVQDLTLVAHNIYTVGDLDYGTRVSVYLAHLYQGEPRETAFMHDVGWWNIQDGIPPHTYPDDCYWLESVINGHRLTTRIHYDDSQLLTCTILAQEPLAAMV